MSKLKVLGLAFLLSGCFILPPKTTQKRVPPPARVSVVHPKMKSLKVEVPFLAHIILEKQIVIHSQLKGIIKNCPIRVGKKVKKGDLLCQMDDSLARIEEKRAKDAMNSANNILKSNLLEKQESLFQSGVIGQSEYEKVRIQFAQSQARYLDAKNLYSIAKKRREIHKIMAPIDGKVASIFVKSGNPVAPQVPLLSLFGGSQWILDAKVHAKEFSKIKLGQRAKVVYLSGFTLQRELLGAVTFKSVHVDVKTQSFQVKITLDEGITPGAHVDMAPGMLATGFIYFVPEAPTLVIPQASLVTWHSSGLAQVYVVNEKSLAELVEVKVGHFSGGQVSVLGGLLPETLVLSDLSQAISPFVKVQPIREPLGER